jgi:phospholipid/cholesterol/gamma-HCH transport system substrate-binding protein
MRRAIRKHITDFSAIIVLAVIAVAVAGYVLHNERLRFPLIESAPFKLKAAFSTAQAVTPGQGQTVRVSGVRVGDIASTKLENGKAIVTMAFDPKYKDLVHTNATAFLRPKTGLKDMFIELNPGRAPAPVAKQNWTIPIQNTLPDVNPDEVYAALDSDTRDYLKLLVQGAGEGLQGRGQDLQDVFRRFEPTHRDLARITELVAQRHQHLRHLINALNVLNGELAGKQDQLAELISTSSAVFRAFASEHANITRAVGDLPGTLRQTTQTLNNVQQFADALRPAADDLRPAVRSLDKANHAVTPFATEAAPILRTEVRPFVRNARPIVRQLVPPAKTLVKATPDLTRVFVVLNHLLNMVGYNPNGREAPDNAKRDEGLLFWLAWLNHDGAALFSSSDANGPFRPVTLGATCSVLKQIGDASPPLNMILAPSLLDPSICGGPS